jgi:hypothetical protein
MGRAAYLLPPVLLLREGQAQLHQISLSVTPASGGSPSAWLPACFRRVHLLISASLTFSYSMRWEDLGTYLAAVACGVGANAPRQNGCFEARSFPCAGGGGVLALGGRVSSSRWVATLDPALPAAPRCGQARCSICRSSD